MFTFKYCSHGEAKTPSIMFKCIKCVADAIFKWIYNARASSLVIHPTLLRKGETRQPPIHRDNVSPDAARRLSRNDKSRSASSRNNKSGSLARSQTLTKMFRAAINVSEPPMTRLDGGLIVTIMIAETRSSQSNSIISERWHRHSFTHINCTLR